MTPKMKGNRTEGAVLATLMKTGKTVLIPFGDNERYDMVIDEGGKFVRVQCKTGRLAKGVIEFNTCSSGISGSRDYKGQVDIFAVYCAALDRVYMVPVDEVGEHNGFLRVEPAKNGQTAGVRLAKDFELLPA